MLDSFEKTVIELFLSENWEDFQSHCNDHGLDADALAEKLK